MKKKLLLFLTFGILLSSKVYSFGLSGKIKKPNSEVSDDSITTGGSVEATADTTLDTATKINCKDEASKHISLSFLEKIIPEGEIGFSRISGSSAYRMNVPSYLSGGKGNDKCLNLEVSSAQTEEVKYSADENVKYAYMTFKNGADLTWEKYLSIAGTLDPDGKGVSGIDKETFEKMSEEDRITACLLASDVLREQKDGSLSYSEDLSPKHIEFGYEHSFGVHVTKESELTRILIAAASPRMYRQVPAHEAIGGGIQVSVPGGAAKCLSLEKIDDKSPPIAYENGLIKDALHVCSTGDVVEIDKMLELLNKDVMDSQAYKIAQQLLVETRDKSLDETSENIYDELKRIGSEVKKSYRGGKWLIEEDEARELLDEYVKNLKDLNRQVIDSYIRELKVLMKQRKAAKGGERDAIDKRISEINEKMGELSKNKNKLRLTEIEKLAQQFALTDHAEDIRGFFLRSEYLSRVRPKGRNFNGKRSSSKNRAMTFEQADETITKKLAQYENSLEQWELDADARDGDFFPARISENRLKSIKSRMQDAQKRYQQEEQRNMQYCQASFGGFQRNPVRCKRAMDPSARQRRSQNFQRRMARYQASYANESRTYQRRRGYADDARRRVAEEEDDYSYYDDYDSFSSGGFDDYLDYNGYDSDYGFSDNRGSSMDRYSYGGNNFASMNGRMSNPYQGQQQSSPSFSTQSQAMPFAPSFSTIPQQGQQMNFMQQQMPQAQGFAPSFSMGQQQRFY